MAHLKQPLSLWRLTAVSAAALLASNMAHAAVVTTAMIATGTYSLGGAPTTSLSSVLPNNPVDVLSFPNSGSNNAGLHSYGSTTGNFGSRSSGAGVYDVTGSFKIVQTITNDTGAAKNAVFNFYITPGALINSIYSPLSGSSFVSSGLKFDLKRNGTAVWGSDAKLTSNSAGTTFNLTGDNLYSGGGAYYAVAGAAKSIDLGVLNAGESVDISYELQSFAKGNSVAGTGRNVPETSYFVPDQWVTYTDCGYGYGDTLALGANNAIAAPTTGCTTTKVFVPGHTVVVPAYTVPGGVSGSQGSSGDPFEVNFQGNPVFNFPIRGNATSSFDPFGTSVSLNGVPEPGTLALLMAGLGFAAWSRRRSPKAM